MNCSLFSSENINTAGLVLDIIGIIWLSVRTIKEGGIFYVYNRGESIPNNYVIKSLTKSIGLWLVMVGFILQIASNYIAQ